MEKGLYAVPLGMDDQEEQGLEIEIVDPKMVTLSDGSVEITLIPDAKEDEDGEFSANLAETIDDGELQSLASELLELVDGDVNSRKDWADTYVKGLDVLGFKYEERTEPWQDACGGVLNGVG